MSIFWISVVAIYVLLFVVAFFGNKSKYDAWMFYIDLNLFNSPFYNLGISNQHQEHSEDVPCTSKLQIGFVFINFGFLFFDSSILDENS